MPLPYDEDDPKSDGGATLFKMAALLATAPPFWTIANVNAITAPGKIIVGIHTSPEDGEHYSVNELKELGCEAQVFAPHPSQGTTIQNPGGPTPLVGGVHRIMIRRFVQAEEADTHSKRNLLYLGFYDHIEWLKEWLVKTAESEGCPRVPQIIPDVDAAYSVFDHRGGQGEYLWARFDYQWGDTEDAL